jgi:cold shock protein
MTTKCLVSAADYAKHWKKKPTDTVEIDVTALEPGLDIYLIRRTTRMNGTIRIINTEKGFGFILGEDKKDYFFHRSALKNAQFDDLQRGDKVEFTESEGQKGPRAEDVYV